MEDVRENTKSEIHVKKVRYGVDVPDALFEPSGLADAAESPLWSSSER
jgi:hypothetical protein